MNNKELLEKVIEDRLGNVLEDCENLERQKEQFREAMEALDRKIALDKIEDGKHEQETVQVEQKQSRVERYVLGIAVPIVMFGLKYMADRSHTTRVCNFEKDYTFTTTPAKKIIGNLFNSKK